MKRSSPDVTVSCVLLSFRLFVRGARIFSTSRTDKVEAIAYAVTATDCIRGRRYT